MPKKQPLEIGQHVWIESTDFVGRNSSHHTTTLTEMVVLEANKTSAYIWTEEQPETRTRYKVNQRTHRVTFAVPTFQTYRLWLSREDYYRQKIEKEEREALLEDAEALLRQMNLTDLRHFVKEHSHA